MPTCQEILAFLLLLFLANTCLGSRHTKNFSEKNSTYIPIDGKYDIVVELAIVCDFDFSSIFQNNYQRIVEFWTALLWDVHLKFRTIQNISVSFRVNSIVLIENQEEQPFIEAVRFQDGTLNFTRSLLNFENWLYDKAVYQNLTNYDIAIAAVGSTFADGYLGTANEGLGCAVDLLERKVSSALMISMQNNHMGPTLAHELAHLLGVPDDSEGNWKEKGCEAFNATNPDQEYIMGNDGERKLWEYFFSPCSQKSMRKFLQLEQANCFRNLSTLTTPLIDTSSQCNEASVYGGISLEEQCRVFINSSEAYIVPEDSNCLEAKCHMDLADGMFSTFRKFDPFDGTPCQDGGIRGQCFLGSCIPRGGHLVHIASGLCLQSANPYSMKDEPVLYDCLNEKSATPMDFVRLKILGTGNMEISVFHSTPSGNETGNKCLGISNPESPTLTFENCTKESVTFHWELERVKTDGHMQTTQDLLEASEFLLFHATNNKLCVEIAEGSRKLQITRNCSILNSRQRWKYVEEIELHKHSSCRNFDRFEPISNGNTNPCFQHGLISTLFSLLVCYINNIM